MNRKIAFKIQLVLALFVIVVAAASQAQAARAVKFFGTAQAGDLSPRIAQQIADSGVDVDGYSCFQLPIFDLASGRPLGTGVDCLNVFDGAGDAVGDGLQIEAKTFFFFPQGLVVNHGCTSVRPFFDGVGNAGATHMSGSIPGEEFGAIPAPIPACDEAGGVIHATGGFHSSSGPVRLSGAVNLSNAGAGEITFSCIFVLDLEPGDSDEDDDDDD